MFGPSSIQPGSRLLVTDVQEVFAQRSSGKHGVHEEVAVGGG